MKQQSDVDPRRAVIDNVHRKHCFCFHAISSDIYIVTIFSVPAKEAIILIPRNKLS